MNTKKSKEKTKEENLLVVSVANALYGQMNNAIHGQASRKLRGSIKRMREEKYLMNDASFDATGLNTHGMVLSVS